METNNIEIKCNNFDQLKDLLKNFINIDKPKLNSNEIKYYDLNFDLSQVEIKSRYSYSSRQEAVNAAIKELNTKFLKALTDHFKLILNEYQQDVLLKFLKDSNEENSYYAVQANILTRKLVVFVQNLEKITGKKIEFSEEFYLFNIKVDKKNQKNLLSVLEQNFIEDVLGDLNFWQIYQDSIKTDCEKIYKNEIQHKLEPDKKSEAKFLEYNLFEQSENTNLEFNLFTDFELNKYNFENNDFIERWNFNLTEIIEKILKKLEQIYKTQIYERATELLICNHYLFLAALKAQWQEKEEILQRKIAIFENKG